MEHISNSINRVLSDSLNAHLKAQINKSTNRHIAKVLTRLNERYDINNDINEVIKVQFRMLQNDILEHISETQLCQNQLKN